MVRKPCSRKAWRCRPAKSSTPPVMSAAKLRAFLAEQIAEAKAKGVLLSLHLKATMMKVSDPIMFGHAGHHLLCRCALKSMPTPLLNSASIPTTVSVMSSPASPTCRPNKRPPSKPTSQACYAEQARPWPWSTSDKGITNLHVPSDVIIDASMPAMIRASGQMWGPDGKQKDTKAVIPDRCYAGVYKETIDFCKAPTAPSIQPPWATSPTSA